MILKTDKFETERIIISHTGLLTALLLSGLRLCKGNPPLWDLSEEVKRALKISISLLQSGKHADATLFYHKEYIVH